MVFMWFPSDVDVEYYVPYEELENYVWKNELKLDIPDTQFHHRLFQMRTKRGLNRLITMIVFLPL